MDNKIELEILYDSLKTLQNNGQISINQIITDQLRAEATRQQSNLKSSLLTNGQKTVAKQLKNNSDIGIRKADKSNTFIILNKCDYISKINNIISDTTKFKKIQRDPTKLLKAKVNTLIDSVKSVCGQHKLNKIIGEYEPGYIYGNVKTHNINPVMG